VGDARHPNPDVLGRVQALIDRYPLADAALPALLCFLGLLVSDPLAPTSVRDPLKAIDDHFADSLVALELPEVRSASRIADLGSGAGLPGIALAIALDRAEVEMVESSARKCAFISRSLAACEVPNATVVNARAEAWPAGLDRFDLVTVRALGPLPVVAEYAAPLLRMGGALVAWRGQRDLDAEDAGARAALELGLEVQPPIQVHPYAAAEHRHLHVMSKVRETPSRFPRRPGTAVKRPLGGDRNPSDRSRR
jgi:16S rRNA (guanine527-N7)-methyltransferase